MQFCTLNWLQNTDWDGSSLKQETPTSDESHCHLTPWRTIDEGVQTVRSFDPNSAVAPLLQSKGVPQFAVYTDAKSDGLLSKYIPGRLWMILDDRRPSISQNLELILQQTVFHCMQWSHISNRKSATCTVSNCINWILAVVAHHTSLGTVLGRLG